MNKSDVKRCLCCCKPLLRGETDYHAACARRLFGNKLAPILPYSRDNIDSLALDVLKSNSSVTGVQAKLSLDLNKGGRNEVDRLTIVGLWGRYILKPQSPRYKAMPELENTTMQMAEVAGIATVPHGLIRMSDGELAYITRRIDRNDDGTKHSLLDMCQLTNRLTEHKYRGAYTQLAEVIRRYSSAPMLDVQRFWEIVIFSWIVGNSDMHCKNFSLIENNHEGYSLSPAYDLLAVHLTGIDDHDELAMPLTGYGVDDNATIGGYDGEAFVDAMVQSGIDRNIAANIVGRFRKFHNKWTDIIECSFLAEDLKEQFKRLVAERLSRL